MKTNFKLTNRATLNNKINTLHKRCLRIIYNDKQSTFKKLLDKDKSVSIHSRDLQNLAIKMFKITKTIAPGILANIFNIRILVNDNLRHS